MANGFVDPLEGLNAFQRFGLGTRGAELRVAAREKAQIAKRAALQLALERTPIDAPNRPELEAEFGRLTGVPTIGLSFRPEAAEPEAFTLGPNQTRFEQSPGQPPRPVARGVASSGTARATETQRGIAELQARGFALEDAQDIQRGRVRATTPDAFGNIFLVNSATGEMKLARRGGGAPPPRERGEGPDPQPQQPGLAPLESASVGVGPVARAKQLLSDFIGPFIDGGIFQDTVQARQRLGLFNKTLERSLINNPKFPVAEVGRVGELLPNVNTFFTDQDAARNNLIQTRDFMRSLASIKQSEMEAPGVTSKRKAELADQISILRENLALFGPLPGGNISAMTPDQLTTVDVKSLTDQQLIDYLERIEGLNIEGQ